MAQKRDTIRANELRDTAGLADLSSETFNQVRSIRDDIIEKNYLIGSGNEKLEENTRALLNTLGYNHSNLADAVLEFKGNHYFGNGAEIGPSFVKALTADLVQFSKNNAEIPAPNLPEIDRQDVLKTLAEGNIFNEKATTLQSRDQQITELKKITYSSIEDKLVEPALLLVNKLDQGGDFGIMDGQDHDAIGALKVLLVAAGYYDQANGLDNNTNKVLQESWKAFTYDHWRNSSTAVGIDASSVLIKEIAGNTEFPKRSTSKTDSLTEKTNIESYPSLGEILALKPEEVNELAVKLTLGLAAGPGVVKQTRGNEVINDLVDKGYVKLVSDNEGTIRIVPGGNRNQQQVETIGGSNGIFSIKDFGKREDVINQLYKADVLEKTTNNSIISARLPEDITYEPLSTDIPNLSKLEKNTVNKNTAATSLAGGIKDAFRQDIGRLANAHTFLKEIDEGTWKAPKIIADRSLPEQFAVYMVQKEGKNWHQSESTTLPATAGEIGASVLTSTIRPADIAGNMLVHGATDAMNKWEEGKIFDISQTTNTYAQAWLDIGTSAAGVISGNAHTLKSIIIAGASTTAITETLQNQIDKTKGGEAAANVVKAVVASILLEAGPDAAAKGITRLNTALKNVKTPSPDVMNTTSEENRISALTEQKETFSEARSTNSDQADLRNFGKRTASISGVEEALENLEKPVQSINFVRYNQTQEQWGRNHLPEGYNSVDDLPPQGIGVTSKDFLDKVRPGYEHANEILKSRLAKDEHYQLDGKEFEEYKKQFWSSVKEQMDYKGIGEYNVRNGEAGIHSRRNLSDKYYLELTNRYKEEMKATGIEAKDLKEGYILQQTSLLKDRGLPIEQNPYVNGWKSEASHLFPGNPDPLLRNSAKYYNQYIDSVKAGNVDDALDNISKFVYSSSAARPFEKNINHSVIMAHTSAMLRGVGIDDFSSGDLDLIAHRSPSWDHFDFFFKKALSGELDQLSGRQLGYVVGVGGSQGGEKAGATVILPP
jgi:hypothetical protein